MLVFQKNIVILIPLIFIYNNFNTINMNSIIDYYKKIIINKIKSFFFKQFMKIYHFLIIVTY